MFPLSVHVVPPTMQAEALFLAACFLVQLNVGVTEFTLERLILLKFCAAAAPISCSSSEVATLSADWTRWLLSLTNVCALAMLPVFAAVSDYLKQNGKDRLPLMAVQCAALGSVPLLYLLHDLFALPQWLQLLVPTTLALLGSELNVILPSSFAARSDLFAVNETRETARGAAFLRVELVMYFGSFLGATLTSWLIHLLDERLALRLSFLVGAICGWGASTIFFVMIKLHLHNAHHSSVKGDLVIASRAAYDLAPGAYPRLARVVRDGIGETTPSQKRWILCAAGAFSLTNGLEGMPHINALIWARLGFSASDSALLYAISKATGMVYVILALGITRLASEVEQVIVVMACIASVAPLLFALGMESGSRFLVTANAALYTAYGPVVFLTRSLFVLYTPAAYLGSALCLLGMLDELSTAVGNFAVSSIFARTAGTPSVVAWFTTAGWVVIIILTKDLLDQLRRPHAVTQTAQVDSLL